MEIGNIVTMKWGDASKTGVIVETDDGQLIGTPYSEESIIWDKVQAFPVDQIADPDPIVEPPQEAAPQ